MMDLTKQKTEGHFICGSRPGRHHEVLANFDRGLIARFAGRVHNLTYGKPNRVSETKGSDRIIGDYNVYGSPLLAATKTTLIPCEL